MRIGITCYPTYGGSGVVATELGVDATLSVTPYYVKPSPRGILRHYEEVARATDKPVVLYNIPGRTAVNMGPELLARLAQVKHIDAVKQSNDAELQQIDGLELYTGNDESFARTLDSLALLNQVFGSLLDFFGGLFLGLGSDSTQIISFKWIKSVGKKRRFGIVVPNESPL